MARRTVYRLTAPKVPEHAFQAALAKTLTIEIAPAGKLSSHGVVWFSVDHANFAGEVPGIRIGRGIIAGILDTFVLYRGRCYLVELKAEGGVLSDSQQATIAASTLAGVPCAVCNTIDDVIRALDEWGVPRNRRVMFQVPAAAI